MRTLLQAGLALVSALMLMSCASAPQPAGEPGSPAPSPQDPALTERAAIDDLGARADCADLQRAGARRSWLGAWCGLRTEDWALAARNAARARRYFDSSGELRRHIEMTLLEAIAGAHLGDPRAPALARRAHTQWSSALMPLHGGLRDPFAGDLSYLFARAISAELLAAPRTPRGHAMSVHSLFKIARAEYGSFGRFAALPHVARAATRHHLDDGAFDRAIASLSNALHLDRRAERRSGLEADLWLFAELADALGLSDGRAMVRTVLPATAASPGTSQDWGTSTIEAKLARPAGRRRLWRAITKLRSSAASAIRPPEPLLAALRAHRDFSGWRGDSWRLAYQAGQLLGEQGHRADARRYLHAAVDAIERARSTLPTPALRQRFFADKRRVYMALVDAYVGLDTANRTQRDYRRSLQLANALKARGLLDLLDVRLSPELATARPGTRFEADRTLQRTADRILARLNRWNGASSAHSGAGRADFSGLASRASAQLGARTALVEYLIAPRRSYVWVLRPDGVEMRRIAGREELVPLVDAFVATLSARPEDREAHGRHRRLAERLYVELIGPIEDLVVDAERLVFAPDERLYELPFAALARPSRGERLDYLVRGRAISYIPSAAVFARLAARPARPPSKRALVMGDPDLARPAVDLLKLTRDLPNAGLGELDALFPALPAARAEMSAVGKLLAKAGREVDMLAGARATESYLRTSETNLYDLVHLASHGVSDARSLEINAARRLDFSQPALLLARDDTHPDDGILTLAEVLNRPIAANLVVLSGCTTGRGWRTLGDGAFGLAGAFLFTGSRQVIASGWKVADDDTSRLMRAAYAAIARGEAPPAALRAGQLAMLAGGAPPSSWAAFRLIGP